MYSNSPNYYYDTIQHSQGLPPIPPTVRIAPAPVVEPLNYTHYDFLQDYFKKYYNNKQLDPIIVLHIIKIIELSLSHVQNTGELIMKYKQYFKL